MIRGRIGYRYAATCDVFYRSGFRKEPPFAHDFPNLEQTKSLHLIFLGPDAVNILHTIFLFSRDELLIGKDLPSLAIYIPPVIRMSFILTNYRPFLT